MATPKTISMLDLRQRAEQIVEQVRAGETLVLTYRGRPVLRLEPIRAEAAPADDRFYRLADLASDRGKTLSNREIDEIVYGP
jgi:prevent-host-death family protein